MTALRKFGLATATGVALVLGVLNAPVAAAAPVDATTLTRVVGSGSTGSFGYGGALVNETVSVTVDPERPGTSTFHGSMWCYCTVDWTNLSTGARGTVELPVRPMIGGGLSGNPVAETGSGRIVAVVTAPGFTYLPGGGSWTVP